MHFVNIRIIEEQTIAYAETHALDFSHFLILMMGLFVRDTGNPLFVNHKGKGVDWIADQRNERSVLGHAQLHKGRMKGHDPEINTTDSKALVWAPGSCNENPTDFHR